MRARGYGILLLALIALGVARAPSAAQIPAGYKVIVNPNNPISAVHHDFLRNVFLKKATQWGNNDAVYPIDLTWKNAVRAQFTQGVLHKTPAQARTYWTQQIFTGKSTPPPEVDTVAAVIAYVVANPGAVGYIPIGDSPGGAKVIKVY